MAVTVKQCCRCVSPQVTFLAFSKSYCTTQLKAITLFSVVQHSWALLAPMKEQDWNTRCLVTITCCLLRVFPKSPSYPIKLFTG